MNWNTESIAKLSTEQVKALAANADRLGQSSVADLCRAELLKRTPVKAPRPKGVSSRSSAPVKGFHFVCKSEVGVTRNSDGTFWSGTWVVSEKSADDLLKCGGYVALHSHRGEPSYLQGNLKAWRKSPREKRYGDIDAQTRYGIDFLVESTPQAYVWIGDATGEKGYARHDENSANS